ncbi:MAG: lysophospholipid acyltransferase family protein [Acidobacteria bacterium]|nr:lysophospholipid acyltransferase family protein [Acidobacteriota bacterium]
MKNYIMYLVIAVLLRALGLLPRNAALRVAESAAALYFRLDGRHRRIADTNLNIAFPDLSPEQRRRIAVKSYRTLGRLVVEVSRFPRLHPGNIASLVSYDPQYGEENLKRALAAGRGVMYLTAHFGCWELLAYALSLYGYPLLFVNNPLRNRRLEELLTRYRTGCGNRGVTKQRSARSILTRLHSGGAVSMMVDQNVSPSEGVFVHFFGKRATMSSSVAILARRTGAAVIPVFLVREGNRDHYRIRLHAALELVETEDRSRDVLINTQRFATEMESVIRQYPEQWLWVHRRWRSRPPEDPAPLYDVP